jgi:hypothetical protein
MEGLKGYIDTEIEFIRDTYITHRVSTFYYCEVLFDDMHIYLRKYDNYCLAKHRDIIKTLYNEFAETERREGVEDYPWFTSHQKRIDVFEPLVARYKELLLESFK